MLHKHKRERIFFATCKILTAVTFAVFLAVVNQGGHAHLKSRGKVRVTIPLIANGCIENEFFSKFHFNCLEQGGPNQQNREDPKLRP